MSVRKSIYAVSAALALLLSGLASANEVADLGSVKKIGASDIVLVGQVAAIQKVKNSAIGRVGMWVRVEKMLKGKFIPSVHIWSITSTSEMNLCFCEVGKRYIFFLQKSVDGQYVSSNGRFGVVALDR